VENLVNEGSLPHWGPAAPKKERERTQYKYQQDAASNRIYYFKVY
jgi:hypothetical protein